MTDQQLIALMELVQAETHRRVMAAVKAGDDIGPIADIGQMSFIQNNYEMWAEMYDRAHELCAMIDSAVAPFEIRLISKGV